MWFRVISGHGSMRPWRLRCRQCRRAPASVGQEHAAAHDAIRVRTKSARDVKMTGTRAPSTSPAASALARNMRILRQHIAGLRNSVPPRSAHVPQLLSGYLLFWLLRGQSHCRKQAARQAVRPRSARDRPFCKALPLRWWKGIFDVTVSTAERMATRGTPRPTCVKRSIAFWMMSRFASRSGNILIAASSKMRSTFSHR